MAKKRLTAAEKKKREVKREALRKRLTDPLFLTAMATVVYQLLQKRGVIVDLGTFQLYVDLACYAILGSGIYSTFGAEDTTTKE